MSTRCWSACSMAGQKRTSPAFSGRVSIPPNQYVKRLYRKFGINNSVALMSLWLCTTG
jgi:hypothetical protein